MQGPNPQEQVSRDTKALGGSQKKECYPPFQVTEISEAAQNRLIHAVLQVLQRHCVPFERKGISIGPAEYRAHTAAKTLTQNREGGLADVPCLP